MGPTGDFFRMNLLQRRMVCFGTVFSATVCAVLFPAAAQEGDENAKALLEKAMRDVAAFSSLGVDFSANTRVARGSDGGEEVSEEGFTGTMLLRGTTDLWQRLRQEEGGFEVQIISNGKVHNVYLPAEKRADRLEQEVPRDVLVAAAMGGLLKAPGMWLADFLHGNKDLVNDAQAVSHAGTREMAGLACDGITLAYEGFDVTAWLAPGETRRLAQLNADLSKAVSAQAHGGDKITAEVVFQFSNWRINPELKDEQFVFTAPEGVKVQDRKEPGPGEGRDSSLKTGSPAPDFTLPLLKGGEMTLSADKGKVVVLDFWASWCGPCRQAMPVIEKVVHAHADKGVKLYAINQAEPPETVTKFLESRKMDMPVPMDKDGKVGSLYGVQGIPFIVVVDGKGLVSEVFAGMPQDFEAVLTKAVQKALAS